MCVSPYIVKTDEGLVPVPCGKCYECLTQWTKDWRLRLKAELDNCVCSFYLTLTYDPKFLPVAYNFDAGEFQSYLVKSDLQKFFKRVRKNNSSLKFRYFAIGEYGGDYNRCHFHICFFFSSFGYKSKNQLYNYFHKCWGKGYIYLKATEKRHINYVSTYFNKVDKSSHIVEPFKCMSKSLGLCWLTPKRVEYFFKSFATAIPNPFGKGWCKLPRYFRKKLDSMTSQVVDDPCGYVWSDISRWKSSSRQYKGKEKEFDFFCKNYETIFADFYRRETQQIRNDSLKYQLISHDINPAKIFYDWSERNPIILGVRLQDKRLLENALVQHKYTRLNQFDYV